MKDLKGKKVGVPEGTSGAMVLGLALEKAGMSETDIEKVPMDPSTVVSAFASGQIDGAGLWYPLIDTIKAKKPKLNEVASTAAKDFEDQAFPNAFVAPADGDEKLNATVVKVLQKANDWRAAHPRGVRRRRRRAAEGRPMYDIGASDHDPSLSAFETDDTTWTATADPGGTLAETP
ncbi:ABC transporter substrate-binding protein [Streptomyces sp. NPDC006978]|uniref:ABC transporter substrate-binding protein n=1 Tax=Streptomyces sp. NPDC006978 TaxID=3364769 RepID=UPI0036BCB0E5